jgi:hypothetical protein
LNFLFIYRRRSLGKRKKHGHKSQKKNGDEGGGCTDAWDGCQNLVATLRFPPRESFVGRSATGTPRQCASAAKSAATAKQKIENFMFFFLFLFFFLFFFLEREEWPSKSRLGIAPPPGFPVGSKGSVVFPRRRRRWWGQNRDGRERWRGRGRCHGLVLLLILLMLILLPILLLILQLILLLILLQLQLLLQLRVRPR